MTTLLLALSLSAPPAVPFDPPAVAACPCGAACGCDSPCRCVKAPADPYATAFAAVEAGGVAVIYVGVTPPAGVQPLPTAAVPALDGFEPGTWVAHRAGGKSVMHRLAAHTIARVSGFRPATLCYAVRQGAADVWVCPLGRLAREQ